VQVLGIAARERGPQARAARAAPGLELLRRARDQLLVRLGRHLRRQRFDALREPLHGARPGRAVGLAGREFANPFPAQALRHDRRPEPASAQEIEQHFVLARVADPAAQRARPPARCLRLAAACPQPQRCLQPPRRDPEVVQRALRRPVLHLPRLFPSLFRKCRHARAQALRRGGREAGGHWTGSGTLRVRRLVTRMASSCATSSTSRIASSGWKP